jgi:methylase of polypeptide subunit release factors
MIVFEIGYTQGDRIRNMALEYLGDVSVSIEKDLSNRDRFVFIFSESR